MDSGLQRWKVSSLDDDFIAAILGGELAAILPLLREVTRNHCRALDHSITDVTPLDAAITNIATSQSSQESELILGVLLLAGYDPHEFRYCQLHPPMKHAETLGQTETLRIMQADLDSRHRSPTPSPPFSPPHSPSSRPSPDHQSSPLLQRIDKRSQSRSPSVEVLRFVSHRSSSAAGSGRKKRKAAREAQIEADSVEQETKPMIRKTRENSSSGVGGQSNAGSRVPSHQGVGEDSNDPAGSHFERQAEEQSEWGKRMYSPEVATRSTCDAVESKVEDLELGPLAQARAEAVAAISQRLATSQAPHGQTAIRQRNLTTFRSNQAFAARAFATGPLDILTPLQQFIPTGPKSPFRQPVASPNIPSSPIPSISIKGSSQAAKFAAVEEAVDDSSATSDSESLVHSRVTLQKSTTQAKNVRVAIQFSKAIVNQLQLEVETTIIAAPVPSVNLGTSDTGGATINIPNSISPPVKSSPVAGHALAESPTIDASRSASPMDLVSDSETVDLSTTKFGTPTPSTARNGPPPRRINTPSVTPSARAQRSLSPMDLGTSDAGTIDLTPRRIGPPSLKAPITLEESPADAPRAQVVRSKAIGYSIPLPPTELVNPPSPSALTVTTPIAPRHSPPANPLIPPPSSRNVESRERLPANAQSVVKAPPLPPPAHTVRRVSEQSARLRDGYSQDTTDRGRSRTRRGSESPHSRGMRYQDGGSRQRWDSRSRSREERGRSRRYDSFSEGDDHSHDRAPSGHRRGGRRSSAEDRSLEDSRFARTAASYNHNTKGDRWAPVPSSIRYAGRRMSPERPRRDSRWDSRSVSPQRGHSRSVSPARCQYSRSPNRLYDRSSSPRQRYRSSSPRRERSPTPPRPMSFNVASSGLPPKRTISSPPANLRPSNAPPPKFVKSFSELKNGVDPSNKLLAPTSPFKKSHVVIAIKSQASVESIQAPPAAAARPSISLPELMAVAWSYAVEERSAHRSAASTGDTRSTATIPVHHQGQQLPNPNSNRSKRRMRDGTFPGTSQLSLGRRAKQQLGINDPWTAPHAARKLVPPNSRGSVSPRFDYNGFRS